ncbi:MAG TPA: Rne/Rng family ribonuclease [Bryobacteraceae bacterium]|nr:Rne/Rng family ribonuclease [Bryobacteraceae bacterium]
MSKELVISRNRHETKVAVLEDDQLVETSFQRANEYSLAGSIHKGRVTRVLPGMQSAFVDLGLERDTFLYVSDFFEEHPDIDTVSDEKEERRPRHDQRRDRNSDRDRNADRERVAETARPVPVEAAGSEAAKTDAPSGETSAEGANETRERRGRRSRRRRSRGRGFPENKYAQPPSSDQSLAAEETDEAESDEAVELESHPASDVLILPGESLKKYRHSEVIPELSENAGLAVEEALVGSDEDESREVPPAGAIPELTDELEENAGESDGPSGGSEDVVEHTVSTLSIHEVTESESATPDAEDSETESAEIEFEFAGEPDEPRLLVLDASPEAVEEALESAEEGISIEGDETASDEGLMRPEDATEEQGGGKAEGQSASVREQSGRYPHRISRRNRRRRGKFGQSGTDLANGGAGTAVSPATEPRTEEVKSQRDEHEARPERAFPSITELLKPGQEIIVQIAKEPLGQKGARITSHVALPGRFVVFMPSVEHLGVSRKIASDEERHRLKKILQAHRAGTTGGFIVRTAGEGHTEDEIAADMNFLYNLWLDIRQKAEKRPAPLLLHHDLDVVQRILRDQLTDEYKAIWVDNEETYESVLSFVQRFQPALVSRVKMYTRSAPIFDAFNVTQELEKALRPKVWLKSGGYIVINQTEALVAIDVNTGKFVGKSNRLEDTIVKTNTEAVKEIVRQIRLRDLGGIIVVDFIDMDERKNRQKVMQALEEAMRADKAPYKILQFNDFGLVAITRKRVKQSLERTLCAPCPYCEGAGYVKSVQTVISEVLIEAQKIAPALEGKDAMLRCNPDVAKVLKSKENQYLEELEEILERPVLVTSDAQLHLEKFDLA